MMPTHTPEKTGTEADARIIRDVRDIDPGRHAVVEASAGTGKTYLIENLVVRLLRERRAPLEKILVVTFTEKATGELKTRIRRRLEDLLADPAVPAAERPLLKDSLETFDAAPIMTIHGFCHRILRQYAFENGEPFSVSVRDDTPLYEKMLKAQMRRDWPRWFGAGLAAALEASGFAGKGEKWLDATVRLARAYRPQAGDRLMHEAPDDEAATGELRSRAVQALRAAVDRYKRERGIISYDDMLTLVERALTESPALLEELRNRYAWALVDEFQDTDAVQWRIFSKLFLGSENHRLVVIGDPKQAIYSFRGADVYAYIEATRMMLSDGSAARYALATNWRSLPQLIDAGNRLFGDGGWFPDADIAYFPAAAPPPAERRTRLYADRTGRAAITAVDLHAATSGTEAHRAMSRFIAEEIERLLTDGGERLIISGREGPVPLGPADICILVKARSKARLIERALRERGIPYAFYKKRGLYGSPEALHVRHILSAIADPADSRALARALLTPFFDVAPADAAAYADLPPDAPLKNLFQAWYGYAASRDWPRLFQSLLEETGVLYRDVANERRLADYRQIIEDLQSRAIGHALDLVDLVALLDSYRRTAEFDDETFDMHRLETERRKVRIMTIHACKGLEFPVVFVADGFGELPPGSYDYWKYHDAGRRVVYDVAKSADGRKKFEDERRREDRQLYYVAATRARYKLYLPYFSGTPRSKGPLTTIVRSAIDRGWPERGQDGTMLRFVTPDGRDRRKTPRPVVLCDALPKGTPVRDPVGTPHAMPRPLFPGVPAPFDGRTVEVTSYSGLKKRLDAPRSAQDAADRSWITVYDAEAPVKEEDDDDQTAPAPAEGTAAPRPALPPGNTTGSMLHEIFEQLDFGLAAAASSPEAFLNSEPVSALIARKIDEYGLAPANDPGITRRRQEETARIVWHTLRTPLKPSGGRALADLDPNERCTELEFYFPAGGDFIMGFIDLVFRFGDSYAILDWKSNYIEEGYSPAAIARNMAESGYELQYKVYSAAVLRWLKTRLPGFDYAKNFGGVYYIYLRGMSVDRPDEGYFYYRPPDEAEILGFEKEIRALVRR